MGNYVPEVQLPGAHLPHVAYSRWEPVSASVQVRPLHDRAVAASPVLGVHEIYTAVLPLLHFSFPCDARKLWSDWSHLERLLAVLSEDDPFWYLMGHATPNSAGSPADRQVAGLEISARVDEVLRHHTDVRAVHCLARLLGRGVSVFSSDAVRASSLSSPALPFLESGPCSSTYWVPICLQHASGTGWTALHVPSAVIPQWHDPALLCHAPWHLCAQCGAVGAHAESACPHDHGSLSHTPEAWNLFFRCCVQEAHHVCNLYNGGGSSKDSVERAAARTRKRTFSGSPR